jgi:hypothetical protein
MRIRGPRKGKGQVSFIIPNVSGSLFSRQKIKLSCKLHLHLPQPPPASHPQPEPDMKIGGYFQDALPLPCSQIPWGWWGVSLEGKYSGERERGEGQGVAYMDRAQAKSPFV